MVGGCQNKSKRYLRLQLFFPSFSFFMVIQIVLWKEVWYRTLKERYSRIPDNSYILQIAWKLEPGLERSLLSFEGLICFDILGQALNRSSSGNNWDNQASPAQYLQPSPGERKLGQFWLCNVHLNGKVHS